MLNRLFTLKISWFLLIMFLFDALLSIYAVGFLGFIELNKFTNSLLPIFGNLSFIIHFVILAGFLYCLDKLNKINYPVIALWSMFLLLTNVQNFKTLSEVIV